MPREKQNVIDVPGELAKCISEALLRERIAPRFVDSYVVENGRHALQVHATLYRELLALVQREALLALTARALAIICNELHSPRKSKPRVILRPAPPPFPRNISSSP